jgi:hypothetical protein
VFDPELDNEFSDKIQQVKRRMQGGQPGMLSENMEDEEI